MVNRNRIITSLSLVLSGLSIFSIFIIILIKGLLRSNIVQLTDPSILDKTLWTAAGICILGIASAALNEPENARKIIFGKRSSHGSTASIILLASIGILVFINIFVYQNPKSWDLTENQSNTLSEETKKLLDALPSKVTASAYFSPQTDQTQARKLLESYSQQNPSNFIFSFIDPVSNPLIAKNDGVDQDGTIVLHMDNKKESVSAAGEEDLDIAIVKLINPIKNNIYFSTGHGEADVNGSEDTAYSALKTGLENRNYVVNIINLGNEIPTDAKVIVLTSLQSPLLENEITNLEKFQNNGGALILLLNPSMLTQDENVSNSLNKILVNWGISENDDIVYDPKANPPLLIFADPSNYGKHVITNKMRGYNSRFFTAASLSYTPKENIAITPLVQTYPEAWGEVNKTSIENNQVAFDQSTDIPGPLFIALAGENSINNSRIVVFGDADFAANALYKQGYGMLLVNSIDWAVKQEKLISLSPKTGTIRTYNPPGNLGIILIIITSICLMPAFILLAGVYAWTRRKKKG
ncbi:MAG: Gldg family protein [Chloroflexota bacterium]